MMKINNILFFFLLLTFIGCSSNNIPEPEVQESTNKKNEAVSLEIDDSDEENEALSLAINDSDDENEAFNSEINDSDQDFRGDHIEINEVTQNKVLDNTSITEEKLSSFETIFSNHVAYINYHEAILSLYNGDYKQAYQNAINAKSIFDNTNAEDKQFIALPYMPSYVREGPYGPKTIYYKIVNYYPYELKRLITKVKLVSPPIATVVINRGSTSITLSVKNFGDLPLDEFEVMLNDEQIAFFETILPNEEKSIRIEGAPKLYEVAFKEKYGFAPDSFILSEDE